MSEPTVQPLYYRVHAFLCTNHRGPDDPRGSCAARGSSDLHKHFKRRLKEWKIENVRINASACLERCNLGPTMVVYPEGVWYSCRTPEDADEILKSHVIEGRPVERLMPEAESTEVTSSRPSE